MRKNSADEAVKNKAARRHAYYSHFLNFVAERQVEQSRWLTASLFAVNSAGLLAVSSHLDDIINPKIPGAAFLAGLALAILNGVALQEFYRLSLNPLTRLTEYWAKSSTNGSRSIRFERHLRANLDKIYRWSWIVPSIGWLSGIACLYGVIEFSLQLRS